MADQNSKVLDLDEIWYSEGFGSLITNPSLKFKNEKWRIQCGDKKYKRWLDSEKNRFLRSPIPNQNSRQK